MMPPLTLFGHMESWVRLVGTWIGAIVLTGIVFGAIARIGKGKK